MAEKQRKRTAIVVGMVIFHCISSSKVTFPHAYLMMYSHLADPTVHISQPQFLRLFYKSYNLQN